MSSTNARSAVVASAVTQVAPSSPAPLARVIPLRPGVNPRASRIHLHDWNLTGDESDVFGRVRELACTGCHAVRYA